jgi:isoleucyl-tRNA synthetase
VSYSDLPKIDQYALFQLENVVASMKDSYDNYQFYKIYQVGNSFSLIKLILQLPNSSLIYTAHARVCARVNYVGNLVCCIVIFLITHKACFMDMV